MTKNQPTKPTTHPRTATRPLRTASPVGMLAATAFLTLAGITTTNASVIITYAESPKQETSSLSGTSLFDFNKLQTGLNTNVSWDGVGKFDQLYILKPNQYGGATDPLNPGGTNYSVQGVGTSVKTTTLTLAQDTGYFGFWWSAGDASNVLDFYSSGQLVAEFTTANLLKSLGPTYNGNPRNPALDSSEPFAFINFYGDAQTTWDQIVFRNSTSSGFESDNFTSRVATYDPATDGPVLGGITFARVTGKTLTTLAANSTGAALWGSADAIPGAPLPALPLLVVFGVAVIAKRKSGNSRENGVPAAQING